MYSAVAGLSWPLLHLAYRLRPRGLENLPANGGFVLACNHVSSFDPWPLGMPLWPKRQLRFMAKSELYWWPLTIVLNGAGAFPVKRGQRDAQAIETAVELVRGGNVVAMFPEGTRRTKGLVTLALLEGAVKGGPTYATCKARKAGEASAAPPPSPPRPIRRQGRCGRSTAGVRPAVPAWSPGNPPASAPARRREQFPARNSG